MNGENATSRKRANGRHWNETNSLEQRRRQRGRRLTVHVLERGRRKRPSRHSQEVLLQAPRQVVGVAEEEALREVHDLVEPLVAKFGDFAVRQSQSHGPLAAIPHGQEHRRRVRAGYVRVGVVGIAVVEVRAVHGRRRGRLRSFGGLQGEGFGALRCFRIVISRSFARRRIFRGCAGMRRLRDQGHRGARAREKHEKKTI